MQQKNFIITELRLYPESHGLYRKNLKSKTYKFNQLDIWDEPKSRPLEREFFGERIFIQTVVGKNGSGKSSVMEVLYRIINNLSYYILKYTKPKRTSAEPVYLIEKLYADLEFIIDDQRNTIEVRDKSLALKIGEEKVFFGPQIDEFKDYIDFNKEKKPIIVQLASSLFYTIVTNYSFQSLISRDFSRDIAKDFVASKKEGTSSGGNWLDSMFRKNDGYITPIVLNPYREEGVVNLQREFDLTLSRIAGLLIQARQYNKELLEGYKLYTIRYTIKHEHFLHKFFKKYDALEDAINFAKVTAGIRERGTVGHQIILAYGIKFTGHDSAAKMVSLAYLVYKTLSVIHKYAEFETYNDVPGITDFDKKVKREQLANLNGAITEIRTNPSHVNLKIYQTLNFVKSDQPFNNFFDLEEYDPFKTVKRFNDLDDILVNLPPPFCTQEIILKKDQSDQEIPLETLSSGERQFIYTVSTLIYHTKNLLSIQRADRIRYRNINIILDEVEICFHPEYQRQFIQNLLDLFGRLNLTRYCSFNIMIITHSPFILSDIPKSNIMYLDDGRQIDDEGFIDPFAANINDILYQSFFLEGGFMGEHAKQKIDVALMELAFDADDKNAGKKYPRKRNWNKQNLKQLIDMIGEPLIKDNLFDLYLKVYEKQNYVDILEQKDEEIKKLTEMLNAMNK